MIRYGAHVYDFTWFGLVASSTAAAFTAASRLAALAAAVPLPSLPGTLASSPGPPGQVSSPACNDRSTDSMYDSFHPELSVVTAAARVEIDSSPAPPGPPSRVPSLASAASTTLWSADDEADENAECLTRARPSAAARSCTMARQYVASAVYAAAAADPFGSEMSRSYGAQIVTDVATIGFRVAGFRVQGSGFRV